MSAEELEALHPRPTCDIEHAGRAYRIDLKSLQVSEHHAGAWAPLRNLDLQADILRTLNDGYGPDGD